MLNQPSPVDAQNIVALAAWTSSPGCPLLRHDQLCHALASAVVFNPFLKMAVRGKKIFHNVLHKLEGKTDFCG
jgi:hypothetical protein